MMLVYLRTYKKLYTPVTMVLDIFTFILVSHNVIIPNCIFALFSRLKYCLIVAKNTGTLVFHRRCFESFYSN